jgi:hypothetical protein
MTMYKFALLDPRTTSAAKAANDAVFGAVPSAVVGIEVTVPALAARCAVNIDPQHSPPPPAEEGSWTGWLPRAYAECAAIDVARWCPLPPDGATIATVRPDLDSIGAMAVLLLRADSGLPELSAEVWDRVALISAADRFARGPWPGPRPLPSVGNRWPAAQAGASDTRELAAIAACVADHHLSLDTRVTAMVQWLLYSETGYDFPANRYRTIVEAERDAMIAALNSGEIVLDLLDGEEILDPEEGNYEELGHDQGSVAVVCTTHRAATMLGYCIAPVVVAENPAFRSGGGAAHRKVTICAWDASHCDIRAALAELAALESGWGGSPTIGGSPQGVSTMLSLETIVGIVAKHVNV